MGIFDPQGIPSSPTSQTTTNTGIAAWAQPYVSDMLTKAQSLANQGPTDLQNQVYAASSGMQTPGQFAQGTNLLNQSGAGMLGTTGTAMGYGQQGAAYGAQGAGAGQAYQQMATDPSQMQQWMNPYVQQALAPQLALLNQQQALQGQGIAAKAAGQGAFGGNRATLAQGLNAQNYALAGQQAIGQGYNEAFRQAQQAQQFRADLGLRGLAAAMQGAQIGLQGVDTAQRGYAGATQAGVGLGNIGAQQGQYDVSKLALQNQIANQQYNLPYQRLQFMQGMLSGLPISTSTTQGYQAGPNKAAQMAGLVGTLGSYAPNIWDTGKNIWNWATSGGGGGGIPYGGDARDIGLSETALSGASYADLPYDMIATGGQIKDGGVKRYAEGGITSINRRVMNDPTAYSAQTIDRSAQNNVLGGVTKLLALDTIAKQRAALAAQQQMQAQPQPPIVQQLAQRAGMGIDNAESNLPQQYAGGGIIAFEDGGSVISDLKDYYEKMKGRLSRASENTTTVPSIPTTFFGIPLFGAANKEDLVQAKAEPLTDSKPDELGRHKANTDTGIVIHDTPTRNAPVSAAPAISGITPPVYRPADTAGIDALTKRYEDMYRGAEDFKAAESKAEQNAMRKFFLGMMANKPGSTFVQAAGEAGLASQEGLEKTQEGIQARKDKQIGQLIALGLKGEDLKNAARKIGIDETELQAKLPALAAEANYKNAYAKYLASGKGGSGGISAGSIGAKDYFARRDMYRSFALNPKSNPELFATLPADVQKALSTKPGSPSYQRGLDAVKVITDRMLQQDINEARAVGAKKVPLSSIED